ncbi:54S ribosomal protein L2 mitochondrial [Neocucurbitaria cava]|uniref:Large ribosomal subunit protein bL27m n=1 Tax=Neocucurbitaria cava TaxID=798079 RepID=A0A9W9CQR2_9PLEO|nr:54S ribosomal protein L2 mitochondrial [Neocucurbitaria cava]
MLLPRILAPVRASIATSSTFIAPSTRVLDALRSANASAAAPIPTLSFVRHSAHQAQGRANGAKDGPGKRLGAKKSGGEFVIPGNIIFRQCGTSWFPGENCKFGRDHCIFATESGYVRYYRDPRKHPKRQYIGVALEKEHTLPYPPNAARRRRLNMLAVPITATSTSASPTPAAADVVVANLPTDIATSVVRADTPREATRKALTLRTGKGYAYREANWQIGRAAERANVQVKQFVPGDRWTAWRKSNARIEANVERKRLRNAGKKTAKPKARKARN